MVELFMQMEFQFQQYSKEEAKIIKPTMEEWKKFQENKIPLTLL